MPKARLYPTMSLILSDPVAPLFPADLGPTKLPVGMARTALSGADMDRGGEDDPDDICFKDALATPNR